MSYENPTGPQQGQPQQGYPQQGYPPPGQPVGQPVGQPAWAGHPAQLSPAQERTWGSGAHWSTLLLGFIGPLVVMLTKGNESAFVRRQATEALNFQITLLIGYLVSFVLMLVLIGFVTFFALWAAGIVFAIIGAIKANSGEDYRYPVAIRIVK